MVVMGSAFFSFAVSDRWLLYTGHFAQVGPGISGCNKEVVAVFNMQ